MATAFSTADAAIIEHQVELNEDAVQATAHESGRNIMDLYDVEATAQRLVMQRGSSNLITPPLQRVALQFPDEALIDSVPLFHALNQALKNLTDTPPSLYILADTSYGSCCVDEVAAAHVRADAIVHYGHTCLSTTATLPALYVFPKRDIDIEAAVQGLLEAATQLPISDRRAVVLTYDVAYTHAAHHIYERLKSQWTSPIPLILSTIDTAFNFDAHMAARDSGASCAKSDSSQACACTTSCTRRPAPATSSDSTCEPISSLLHARQIPLPSDTPLSSTAVLYLGGESAALTHLLLTLGPTFPVASYDPKMNAARIETGKTNRLLMRRYATIQKARDASVIGLVIGTLGIHSYLPLLKELRRILTSPISKRKVYTISVGKLNPAKLANFQEIDAFVLIACPENSLLDTRDFMQPIVTPWEMMLAVQAHGGREVAWTGAYVLDFSDVMSHTAEMDVHASDDASDDERPHYSFATGAYVSRTRYGDTHTTKDSVSETEGHSDAATTTSQALQQLSLEPHQLTVRDPISGQLQKVLDSASLAHRAQRTWHGLDPNEGTGHAAILEQGKAGFAQAYRDADGTVEGHLAPSGPP
ncbi:Diphthamide biosynthesis protein 2 [Malassezia pachydermatis]|uniref:2-(3-amino-3-carboxypropyl)histidine synthase subunit 2 n=1 Tax=Malassezia pachydermatis TaxID=77020 RepID=A0A0M9VQF6_9BASI|nr:diphthamide biosynthesis protein [Malassezia pachydermatis]KOS15469.1 diphthamide biosynthesis protein [Malassezia pachydermatis]